MKTMGRSVLAAMAIGGLLVGVPVLGTDLSAKAVVKKTVAKKAAAKNKPVRRVPLPPPILKAPDIVRNVPDKALRPPVPLRLPKGSPAILVSVPAVDAMGLPAPPPSVSESKAGRETTQWSHLRFTPTVADVQAEGFTGRGNEDAYLMLTVRQGGQVEVCENIEYPSSFSNAMCALIVKSARDMWVAAGNPPRYRYVFLRTQWGISPDIDAKLDLMPEGQGLPVEIMFRSHADYGCHVQITGMSADQESALCTKIKRAAAGYGGRGTNGVAFDPYNADVRVWLRRRPAGEKPTLYVKWKTYDGGFRRPK